MLLKDDPKFQHKKRHFAAPKTKPNAPKSKPDNLWFIFQQLRDYGIDVARLDLQSDTKTTATNVLQFFEPIPASEFRKLPQREYKSHPFISRPAPAPPAVLRLSLVPYALYQSSMLTGSYRFG
jgi:hypothetical protein